jgi:hypothetical protein
MSSWMDSVRSWLKPDGPRKPGRKSRLGVESLEDRATPSIVVGGTAPQLSPPPVWTEVGPAGIADPSYLMPATSNNHVTGAVEAISVDPFNTNRVAVGSVNGGVWITNNYTAPGPVWTTTTDNLNSLSINALSWSPVLQNVIYAGTGSTTNGGLGVNNASGITVKGTGGAPGLLFKSTDGGQTWVQVGGTTFGGRRLNSVVPTALNGGQTVFVATSDSTTPTNTGVYRSDNGGTTWVRLSGANGLPNLPVTDLIPDAANTPNGSVSRYYAAVAGQNGTLSGIYELDTTVSNVTWKNITGNIPNISTAPFLSQSSRIVLASTAAGANPVYAAFIDSTSGRVAAVFRGVNFQPNTFIWTAVGPQGAPPDVNSGGQGETNFAIAADPSSDRLVYVSGDGADAGGTKEVAIVARGDAITNTWTAITAYPGPLLNPAPQPPSVQPTPSNPPATTAPHPDARALVFADNGTLLFSSDGGVAKVTNPQGLNNLPPAWDTIVGNMNAVELYSTAVDDLNDSDPTNDVYLIAAQDNGTAEGTAGATGPTAFTNVGGGDGVLVMADPVGGYRYYASQSFGLDRRNPNGTIVQPAAAINGLPGFTLNPSAPGRPIENLPFQPAVALNQSYPGSMLVGGFGTLYISFDHGDTFDSVFGLNGNQPVVGLPGNFVSAVAFGTVNTPNAAYIATDDGNVFFSSNVTSNFGGNFVTTDFQSIALGRAAVQIAMDPNNPLVAYAVTDRGVFMTTNGQNWTNITSNLLSLTSPGGLVTLASVALFNNNTASRTDDAVVVGGYGGVFSLGVSNIAGGWKKVATGIPDVVVSSVVYDARSDSLTAGTYGRGVFVVHNIGDSLAPGQLITVTGDFNNNDMAVYPDLTDPQFFFVSDGLGNVQRFDSSIFRAVSFKGLSGADTIRIGSPDANTPGRADLLKVSVIADGGSNAGDTLVLDDRADPTGRQTTATSTLINAGAGDDLLGRGGIVSYTGFDRGSVQTWFGTGADTLVTDDSAASAATVYTLAGNTFTRSTGGAPIQYTGLDTLHVIGGSGNNTYQVNSTTAALGTVIQDGSGNGTFNVTGNALTGSLTLQGAGGDDATNLFANTGLTGPVNMSGGPGGNTLNVIGRTSNDNLTFSLTDAVGGAVLSGLGADVTTDTTQKVTLDGRGTNSLTWLDNSGVGFGTPTDPDGGVVFVPSGLSSGMVLANRGLNNVPALVFTGITGNFSMGGATDVLEVTGVSDAGLASGFETTSADGRDTVTVSDQGVTIANAALGTLRSVSLIGGGSSFNTLFVRTGNEKGPEGDTVTITASATLNIVVDGGLPAGTTPGDRAQVIGNGSQTRTQIDDPTFGPPQLRVQFGDGTSAGLIGFENSAGGGGGGGGGVAAVAVGSGPGVPAEAQLVDPVTGAVRFTVFPFGGFLGGVSVAAGDLTGDGIPDLVVGAGPGGGPEVSVYDGATQAVLGTFFAFEPTFTGGVNVALGDFNHDGIADIVLGTGVGGGPRVKVLDGKTLNVIRDVFVYEPSFRGGVSVAVGDVNQDGTPDLITSAGAGGGPRVVIFDGANLKQLASFYVFDPASRDGFFAASADVTGDGVPDIIVGTGAGGPDLVRVYNGATLQLVTEFSPNSGADSFGFIPLGSGIRVGAADSDGDGVAEVITARGPGSSPTLQFWQVGRINPQSNAIEIGLNLLKQVDVFDPSYSAGIYIG